MNQLGNARVRVPERAKRGEVIEIRAMIEHPMESGFRLNNVGKQIPRHIVESFSCEYDGHEVFRAKLHPAQAELLTRLEAALVGSDAAP